METTKKRGRKAEAGTYEARDYVNKGLLDRLLYGDKNLTTTARYRIMKAVKFGLGIKNSEVSCDNCRKCGETVCGNDTKHLSCFEPK